MAHAIHLFAISLAADLFMKMSFAAVKFKEEFNLIAYVEKLIES